MLELHRKLLGDSVRNQALANALKQVIRPGGTTLLDLGSGTGFLSFLASRLGARKCFLYEYGAVMKLAKTLAKANGMRNLQFRAMHSSKARGQEPVDVLISETLGNFALEENIIENIEGAKKFLKPGGAIIPGKIEQFVAPIISSRLYDELNVWNRVGFDIDFSAAKALCMNNMYVKTILASDFENSEAKSFDRIDFTKKHASVRKNTVEWHFKRPGKVFGFGVWWEAELVEGISLSTSPKSAPTHWEQIYLPLIDPLAVSSGDSLKLTITSDSRYTVKIHVTWEVRVCDSKGNEKQIVKMDMRKGM